MIKLRDLRHRGRLGLQNSLQAACCVDVTSPGRMPQELDLFLRWWHQLRGRWMSSCVPGEGYRSWWGQITQEHRQFSVICFFRGGVCAGKAISILSLKLRKHHYGHLGRDFENVLMLEEKRKIQYGSSVAYLMYVCKMQPIFPLLLLISLSFTHSLTHTVITLCVWQLNVLPHSLFCILFDVTDMLTWVQSQICSHAFKEQRNTQCYVSAANESHMLQKQHQVHNNVVFAGCVCLGGGGLSSILGRFMLV